jgi:thiol:disulfide interchange protein
MSMLNSLNKLNKLNKLKSNGLKSGDAAGGAMVGIAGVACVACCAAPIAGVLAGIGLTTAIAAKVFGVAALVIGVAVALVMLRRRRGPQLATANQACTHGGEGTCACVVSPTPIELSSNH